MWSFTCHGMPYEISRTPSLGGIPWFQSWTFGSQRERTMWYRYSIIQIYSITCLKWGSPGRAKLIPVSGKMVPTNQNLKKKNKIASLSFFQRLIKNIDQSGNRRERNPVTLFFRFWFVGTISPETENITSVSMAAGRKRNARIMESPLGMIN